MTVTYEYDTAAWEPWQNAYRFGVILIRPPQPLRSDVNALRSRHDPKSQAYCDAHISLTLPLPAAPTASDWAELTSIAKSLAPFHIMYGPLKHFLPHPGICLEIAPQGEIDRVRMALEGASIFTGAPPRKYPFSAHMTIAEFITAERTVRLMNDLSAAAPVGNFLCAELSYMVPDQTFRFTERATLRLRGTPG